METEEEKKEIRVVVVDDHAILRDGIISLLGRQPGIVVVGEAEDGEEALRVLSQVRPDVVLMDISMPGMDGLESTRHITREYPDMKILILTQHDNKEYIMPILQAGASGYVLKRSGGRELISAIRNVFDEGAFLEPGVAREVLEGYVHKPDEKEEKPKLTKREQEVLQLLIEGYTNKQIANKLVISAKTVAVHRSNIMSKLKVRGSMELARYAIRHKLVDL